MPRETKKRFQYTEEALKKAIDDCNKGVSVSLSAKSSGIPYGTLHRKLKTNCSGLFHVFYGDCINNMIYFRDSNFWQASNFRKGCGGRTVSMDFARTQIWRAQIWTRYKISCVAAKRQIWEAQFIRTSRAV